MELKEGTLKSRLLRVARDVQRPGGERVLAGMPGRGRRGHRQRGELLDLADEQPLRAYEILGELERVVNRRAGMAGDEVGNQVLLLAEAPVRLGKMAAESHV